MPDGAPVGSPAYHLWLDDASPPPPPLASVSSSDALSTTQDLILSCIASHPGVHLRQICRELSLGLGDVQYHIHRLEQNRQVDSVRWRFYRFYFPSTQFGDRQREVLGLLTLDTPRELLLHLIEKEGSSQDELAQAICVSQPTISWHLKRLVKMGLVQRKQNGKSTVYGVKTENATTIYSFVRSYHPTVWDRWSSKLADIFISFSTERNEYRKRR